MNNLKVLSMWQPYLGLMPDYKGYETRHWSTGDRGWVALHATRRSETLSVQREIAAKLSHCTDTKDPDEWMQRFRQYPIGCIVAIARIADQIPMVSNRHWTSSSLKVGDKVRLRALPSTDPNNPLATINEFNQGQEVVIQYPDGEIKQVFLVELIPDGIVIEEQTPVEQTTGLWKPGRYAHKFENFQFLRSPVPFKGRQGKYVPLNDATVKDEILRQLNQDR